MDLAWTADLEGDAVVLTAEYDSDLFDESTMSRMIRTKELLIECSKASRTVGFS